jgi:tetratricopeptide (TPR) repeat protein
MIVATVALALAVSAPASPAAEALAEGDAWYARRAEGAQGGTARSAPIEAGLAAYRRALAADPRSLLVRCRLTRALFFRASFCATTPDQRRAFLEEARTVAAAAVQSLEEQVGPLRGRARTVALRRIPEAAEAHFWAAVAWGEWALVRGKIAAAHQGAGTRIRDLAQTVIDLDPALEQGGGYRILGRLHDQSPKIPFISGWVSRREALENLRRSLERGPDNTVSQLFLAEAILDHDPGRKEEARHLLQQCAATVPHPDYLVEDARYSELARQRLVTLR